MDDITWAKVLAYIDSHVEENPTVADIAAIAGYSAFHFNRLFAARMGAPVMEYMRTRRLHHAAVHVVQGERVLDIALQCGFSSHEGFTRAFKRLFGTSPQRFRLLNEGPYHVPQHRMRQAIETGGNSMEPRDITLDTRALIGYRLHTDPGSIEIVRFWNSVMGDDRWKRLMDKAAPNAMNYGLCIHPDAMPQGQMDYMIAFDYDGKSPIDSDMELFTLEGAQYKVFRVQIPADSDMGPAIKQCWTAIYSEWFPQSGMVYDGDKPDFEAYEKDGTVEIYIPVRNDA